MDYSDYWIVFENENKYSVIRKNWLIMMNNTYWFPSRRIIQMWPKKHQISKTVLSEPNSCKCFSVGTYEKLKNKIREILFKSY